VLIVSANGFSKEITKHSWLQWLRILPLRSTRRMSARASFNECVDISTHLRAEVIMIPNPKEIFPSWTLFDISEKIALAAFGGGAVYYEEKLRHTPLTKWASPAESSGGRDGDDYDGEEWKHAT
jgi:hypothetical protein